jgi:hypothetical protein
MIPPSAVNSRAQKGLKLHRDRSGRWLWRKDAPCPGQKSTKIGGADLNGGGAQRESGGDAASIGNAASGDDRDRNRIEGFGPAQRRSTARG